MSIIEAIGVAQTLQTTASNATQTIGQLQSEFNTGLEQMVTMKEYLEGLCTMLENEGIASYKQADAQQKAEEVIAQMEQTVSSVDIFQQNVVAVHELFEQLVNQLVAATTRD